jgi:hypothetical protein
VEVKGKVKKLGILAAVLELIILVLGKESSRK